MTDRTTLSTRRTLDRLLQGAANELDSLFWFVEMRVSPSLAGGKQHTIAAAAHPPGWVPMVPVADDPTVSRHYADILLECIKAANRGRLIEFGLALTATDVIADGGFQTYEWGDARWDCVCEFCGAVWVATGTSEEICATCLATSSRFSSSPPA